MYIFLLYTERKQLKEEMRLGRFTKQEKSWMLYDLANSAYFLIISTAIFPIYYNAAADNAAVDSAASTAYLGYTISISTFILAILGPVLGTIADYKGMKRKFFIFFFLLGSLSTIALLFVPSDNWLLLLIIYTFTAVGARGANLF